MYLKVESFVLAAIGFSVSFNNEPLFLCSYQELLRVGLLFHSFSSDDFVLRRCLDFFI